MQHQELAKSLFKAQPPPLWYVTNGELTVGPVGTNLLMRGVQHGRVPSYCRVKNYRGHWRSLHTVREIAALRNQPQVPAASAEQLAEWGDLVDSTRNGEELANTLAWLGLVATGADSAMLHCRNARGSALVTRAVLGAVSKERLGWALPETDPLLAAARHGAPVFGVPEGPTTNALAQRFANSARDVAAVAMIPAFIEKDLTVMLELSRPGHAFRCTDLRRAERLLQRALHKCAN